MTTAHWFLFVGGLLLIMGVTPTLLKRLPVTPAMLYLAVGLLMGPTVLDAFSFNPMKDSALLEVLTEVAVLISLFSAGVKMPVPFRFRQWRAPLLLASVSMALTVALVAAFGVWALGLPLGAAVLLGAIVAPTDPVLATDVQSRHPGDRDQLRFTLTCEAGLNDGSAFPFVMLGLGLLGLHKLGDGLSRWLLVDVLWATAGGVAIGVVSGVVLARVGLWLRGAPQRHELLDDFLGLGLIGVVYGLSALLQAWGFLAVFFAAVALRQTEIRLATRRAATGATPATLPNSGGAVSTVLPADLADTDTADPVPSGERVPSGQPVSSAEPDSVSGGALVFKEHLERLSELMLVLLLGGALYLDSWSWPAVGMALFLFFVARPLSVLIGLIGTRTVTPARGMSAWFGVRGIGSLYYLMYAIQHGLPEPLALQLMHLTLIVVTLSILLHGISVKPLMIWVWERGRR